MKRLHPLLSALSHTLRALERSSGRQRARKNARKAAIHNLRNIRTYIDQTYPPLLPDGSEKPKVTKHPCCPVCKIPTKTWEDLAKHLRKYHQLVQDTGAAIYCACGNRFKDERACGRHLFMQQDLKAHVTIARMGRTP